MNIPFPPVLLWPIPIALIVLALFCKIVGPGLPSASLLSRARARISALTTWPRIVILILGVLWSMSLWLFSLPPISGQVLDLETGQPVAGAIVVRSTSRATLIGLLAQSDSHQGRGFYFGRVARITDTNGHYRLPGFVAVFPWGFRGLTQLQWWVRHPDYIPANSRALGVRLAPVEEEPGGPRFVTMSVPADEHRHESWGGSIMGVTFDLKMRRATTAAHKAEVLRRLLYWRVYMIPTREEIIAAAVSLANAPEGISEEAVMPLWEATFLGPLTTGDQKAIDKALLRYCDGHPESQSCNTGGRPMELERIREENTR